MAAGECCNSNKRGKKNPSVSKSSAWAIFIYYASLSAVYGCTWRHPYRIMAECVNLGLCGAWGAGGNYPIISGLLMKYQALVCASWMVGKDVWLLCCLFSPDTMLRSTEQHQLQENMPWLSQGHSFRSQLCPAAASKSSADSGEIGWKWEGVGWVQLELGSHVTPPPCWGSGLPQCDAIAAGMGNWSLWIKLGEHRVSQEGGQQSWNRL